MNGRAFHTLFFDLLKILLAAQSTVVKCEDYSLFSSRSVSI